MIIHPDGRIEGSPEELAQYAKVKSDDQFQDWKKKLGTGGQWPYWWGPQIMCENGNYTAPLTVGKGVAPLTVGCNNQWQ